jgi:hypothetical protein
LRRFHQVFAHSDLSDQHALLQILRGRWHTAYIKAACVLGKEM